MLQINEILKAMMLTTLSYVIFAKIENPVTTLYKKVVAGMVFVIIMSAGLFALTDIITEPFKTAIIIALSSAYVALIFKGRYEVALTTIIISYAICYIIFILTLSIASMILEFFHIRDDNPFVLLLTIIFELIILFFLSKIKTSNQLLHKRGVGGIGLIISGLVFILYNMTRKNPAILDFWIMLFGVALTGYGIYYWWKREYKMSHNERVYELLNLELKDKLDESRRDNLLIIKAHDYMASQVHKSNKQLDALQRVFENLVKKSKDKETVLAADEILGMIKTLRIEKTDELQKVLVNGKELPKTNLQLIDAKFDVLLEKATAQNIEFDLFVKCPVNVFVEVLSQFDFVNIIGDLVENAFIAIRYLSGTDKYRSVLVTLETEDEKTTLGVEDSGIPFDIDTLVKLGVERVTTHSDEGGSGYGFMTIFEKMNKCGASLIIREYEPAPYTYTKRIALRFDGKKEFIIKSYRADEIRKHNKNENLIIVN